MPLSPRALLHGTPPQSLPQSCRTTNHIKQTHVRILKLDPSPSSTGPAAATHLLPSSALSHHGHPPHADARLPRAAVSHWNSLIRGLAATKSPQDAISSFRSMLRSRTAPDNFTFPFLIKACAACSNVRHGAVIHAHVAKAGLDDDPYVQSTLIHMYACGKDLGAARRVFDGCSPHQTVCWNSMLDGCVKNGELGIARAAFDRMECRDVISWNTMINGYALLGKLGEAREMFDLMPHRNVVSWNSMLAGYTKCGDAEGARKVFAEMPQRDVVSWNSMLACYVQSGRSEEALALFDEMQREKMKPTDATVVSLLSACAHLGALDRGEYLHNYINVEKIEVNTILGTALVDMYAKCGNIVRAAEIFRAIELKDVLAWNAIIAGMAVHGQAVDALEHLDEMIQSGIRPDDITFVAVLSACSHAGLVEEGRRLLDRMKGTYGVDPKVEHYGCIIDLLARAGLIGHAVELARAMPMEPNTPAWGALLGGCRIHGNTRVAEDVGKHLLVLQPKHSGRYVLLSNIYATANRWEESTKVRSMMAAKGIAKVPGLSVIELKGTVNRFVAGDRSHRETEIIYTKLSEVTERLKAEAGYSPDTKQVLIDIEEEEKEHALSVHSEKLAIAFALLHTGTGDTVRVVKNLRVCWDCHNAMKLVSKVYCREIVMRDRNRFHLFRDGVCSCMDYW